MNLLEVRELTVRFGGLVANSKVNIKIASGELVGLIGPNGAGKTTCFNVLTGVYAPTEGEVVFDGASIGGVAPHLICKKGIARTFQNIRLFGELTVLENLLIAFHGKHGYSLPMALIKGPSYKKGEARLREKALALLDTMGLKARADWQARNLPYGEQRKLEIARALACAPKLLLLDEPAAGMNPSETAQLSELICEIRKQFNITVLLIEHDMSLVMKICERLYVLDHGELIAQGSPKEIQNNPKVVEAYLGGSVAIS